MTVKYFPVANIYIDTDYFTGGIEALVVPEPVYPLVIGNICDVQGKQKSIVRVSKNNSDIDG